MLLGPMPFRRERQVHRVRPAGLSGHVFARGNRESLNATQFWDKKFDNTCHWRKTLEHPKICLCFARSQSHTRTQELSECERRNDGRVNHSGNSRPLFKYSSRSRVPEIVIPFVATEASS